MANNLGISFSPFGDPEDQQRRGSGVSGANVGPQEAIRLLSLRLPRVIGAAAPAPQTLLTGRGSAAFGASGLSLEQILESMFGRRPRPLGTERIEYPGLQAPWDPPTIPFPELPSGGGGNGGGGGERFDFNDRPNGGGPTTPTPTANPIQPASELSERLGGFRLGDRRRA